MTPTVHSVLISLGRIEETIARLERCSCRGMMRSDDVLAIADRLRQEHDAMYQACQDSITADLVSQLNASIKMKEKK